MIIRQNNGSVFVGKFRRAFFHGLERGECYRTCMLHTLRFDNAPQASLYPRLYIPYSRVHTVYRATTTTTGG